MAGALVRSRLTGRPKILLPRLQTIWSLPAQWLFSSLFYRLAQPYYRSKFYSKLLARDVSGKPVLSLPDDYPGDAVQGLNIVKGILSLGGQVITNPVPLCQPEEASLSWKEELARFDWLRDLRALGGPTARRVAQLMVTRWLEESGEYEPFTWRLDLTAQRLRHLLLYFNYLQDEAGEGRSFLLKAIHKHVAHLRMTLPGDAQGAALLKAALVLMLAGLILPKGDLAFRRGQKRVERLVPQQFFSDGGHKERNPSEMIAILEYIADLKLAFHASGQVLPQKIKEVADHLLQALLLFRHGDGGLALFNGSHEEGMVRLDHLLERLQHPNAKHEPIAKIMQLPITGFQRAEAGQSLLIVDSGVPSPRGFDEKAHAGTSSFEFSHDKERIIVNCGAYPFQGPWSGLGRRTPAHSTLTIDDTDSSLLLEEGGLVLPPEEVVCRRDEDNGCVWLDLQHNGYESSHECQLRRRLFLSADGLDLRGEEQVTSAEGVPFALRFHLHPGVEVSLALDGQSALLKTPKRHVFRLRLAEGTWQAEQSIYFGMRGRKEKTKQLVVEGVTSREPLLIRWALSREDRR